MILDHITVNVTVDTSETTIHHLVLVSVSLAMYVYSTLILTFYCMHACA